MFLRWKSVKNTPISCWKSVFFSIFSCAFQDFTMACDEKRLTR